MISPGRRTANGPAATKQPQWAAWSSSCKITYERVPPGLLDDADDEEDDPSGAPAAAADDDADDDADEDEPFQEEASSLFPAVEKDAAAGGKREAPAPSKKKPAAKKAKLNKWLPSVEIKPSRIHGLGLFAKQKISIDTKIGFYSRISVKASMLRNSSCGSLMRSWYSFW